MLAVFPGDCVYSPRGSVHGFKNNTDQPIRVFINIAPAGFEHFFAEAEARKLDDLLKLPAPCDAKDLKLWQMRVRQMYTSCSNEASTRFFQVDVALKRLCERLRELQGALVTILEKVL